jgi:penicillin-binding protein 1A
VAQALFRAHPDQGNLRAALVTAVGLRDASLRSRDGTPIDLDWDAIAWARPALPEAAVGPPPKAAGDVLAVGQLVYVEPLAEGGYRLAQVPAVGAAFVALDPRNGAIVALVGGFDFAASKYNRAVQAKRQPGSAFKPFLYSAALDHGFTPATLVNDAPIVLPGGGGDNGMEEWRPQNITKKFYGPTPLREALVRSRNLVSIRLLRGTGLGPAIRHISSFGFTAEATPANLTLALGTGQVTPLDMARGFAVFANGGWRVTSYLIEKVEDAAGAVVLQAEPPLACPQCEDAAPAPALAAGDGDAAATESPDAGSTGATQGAAPPPAPGDDPPIPPERRAPRAISAANAYVMTDIMTDVIQRGTAVRARSLGRSDLAGKTGTSSDHRDAWFAGFNADIVGVAWIGFDQERSLGDNEEGARAALPMWIYFMQEALSGRPEHRLPEPPGVVRMWVSRTSGAPSSAGDPGAIFEAFVEPFVPLPGQSGYDSDGVDAESLQAPASDDSIF